MMQWEYFPRFDHVPPQLERVIEAFEQSGAAISSAGHELTSDQVLAVIRPGLELVGFRVEGGKQASQKLRIPVLFGRNGRVDKAFDADAMYYDGTTGAISVIEVEAGRGYTNHQFLKDLFEACMMQDVEYLAIAVRLVYRGNPDFDRVVQFFETLYASRRLSLPLKGILLIGY